MPAKSSAQRHAAGMALAIKRGEMSANHAKGTVKQMAESMTQKQLSEFAKKRKG